MALRHVAKTWVGVTTGLVATAGVAYSAIDDKYFDPEALERGAKVGISFILPGFGMNKWPQ